MAVGDLASAAGYPLVPSVGEEGLVKWGAREINRTRDYIADVKDRISYGTANPSGGSEGDIYFKVV